MSDPNDITLRLRIQQLQEFLRDAKSGKRSIDDITASAKKLGETSAKAAGGSGSGIGKMTGSLVRLRSVVGGYWMYQAATGVGRLVAQTAQLGLTATSQLDTMLTGYTKILGSRGAARDLIGDLQKFSDWSPFEDSDVYKFAQQLLGAGAAAKQIVPSITAIGDAVAAFGGSSEDTLGAIIAIRQIAQNGVLQSQDLNQLAQHGIAAKDILAKGFGVSGTELNKRIEGRQIGSAQAIEILLSGMEKRYGGTLKAQSQTIPGYWSTIKAGLMRSITADPDSPFANALRGWLAKLASDDNMHKIQAWIRGALSKMWDLGKAAKGFFERLRDISQTPGAQRLLNDIGKALGWIKDSLGSVLRPFGQMVSWLMQPGNTDEISSALDSIAAFCENPIVQGALKAIATYAAAMWAFNSATRATAAAFGLLEAAQAFMGFGAGKGAGAAAEGAAGVGTAGKVAAGGAMAGLGPAAWIVGLATYLGRQVSPHFKGQTDKIASGDSGNFWSGIGSLFADPTKQFGSDIKDSWNWLMKPADQTVLSGVPKAARGGEVTSGGLLTVGDAGAETLALPRGARVYPSGGRAVHGARGADGGVYEHTHPIVMDGRKVTKVTHAHADRMEARR